MESTESGRKPGHSAEFVPAADARDRLTELMNKAGYGNERFVLTRNGDPVSAMISMRDLERLEALDDAA